MVGMNTRSTARARKTIYPVDMLVDATFEMSPVEACATHQVQRGHAHFVIRERTSVCGRLQLHCPIDLPTSVRVRIMKADFTFANKTSTTPPQLELQGRVVRCDGREVLVSHGGIMLRATDVMIPGRTLDMDSAVHTVVTW